MNKNLNFLFCRIAIVFVLLGVTMGCKDNAVNDGDATKDEVETLYQDKVDKMNVDATIISRLVNGTLEVTANWVDDNGNRSIQFSNELVTTVYANENYTKMKTIPLLGVDENANWICDYYEERGGETIYHSQQPTMLAPRQVIADLLSGRLHGSCCNKLVARNLYVDNGIRFPEGINCLEDLFVCLRLLNCNPVVAYLPAAFYHYVRIENNSITTTASTRDDMEQDKRLYDMTVALFARDAELQAAARAGIANIMVLRAFHSRRLSSARFRKEFYRFRNDVKARRHKFPFNMFFYLSCVGLYRIMLPLHDTYMWLWKIKHRRKH